MSFTIVAALIVFLVFIYVDARRRTAQHLQCIAEEKSSVASASGMTASVGVFYPDVRTAVVMGASEDTGACYYRVLREGKVINRSKINLANIVRVDLLLNGSPRDLPLESQQATSFLKATEIAGKGISTFSTAELRALQKAALRLVFVDGNGAEKMLEITVLRMGDERHRFKRLELLKDGIWWYAFLNSAARNARLWHDEHELAEHDGNIGQE